MNEYYMEIKKLYSPKMLVILIIISYICDVVRRLQNHLEVSNEINRTTE